MKRLPQLDVGPFLYDDQAIIDAGRVTTYSKLFRKDTRLNEVLELGLQTADPDKLFRVISAGCSFGAEIDSVLGMVEYNSPRQTAVLGVDVNPHALAAARSGKYHMYTSFITPERRYRAAGLDFNKVMGHIQFDLDVQNFSLDTNRLRQKHSVAVREADLSQGLPTKHLANVVMCNNVLFHLPPATADSIAGNLAAHVAPGGVLSFGDNPAQAGMEGNRGMDYGAWLRRAGDRLMEQGMEPALFSDYLAGTAMAFTKKA